jgi:hypothetical protein
LDDFLELCASAQATAYKVIAHRDKPRQGEEARHIHEGPLRCGDSQTLHPRNVAVVEIAPAADHMWTLNQRIVGSYGHFDVRASALDPFPEGDGGQTREDHGPMCNERESRALGDDAALILG